jgi:hypothetical protein
VLPTAAGAPVEDRIDALYTLPEGEFVAARNALARALRAEQDRDAADRVKALPRPNRTAWVVNQLWRSEPHAFRALLQAGARMRRGDLAAGGRDRREALRALLQRARDLLEAEGSPIDPHLGRIEQTLANLSAWGEHPPLPVGQLSAEVDPPDLEDLLATPAVPVPDPLAERRAARDRRKGELENEEARAPSAWAQAVQREAERREAERRETERRAAERARERARRAEALQAGRAALREASDAVRAHQQRLETARRALAEAEAAVRDVEAALRHAEAARDAAEARAAEQEQALAALDRT